MLPFKGPLTAVAGAIAVVRVFPWEIVTNGGGCELRVVNCCGTEEAVVAFTIASLAVFALFAGAMVVVALTGSGVNVAVDDALGEETFTAERGGG